MFKLTLLISFLFCSLAAVCQKMTPEEYVATYKDIAISEMKRTGVPAAITLAQGILETESGNSDLVKKSNNHFGIKCKSNWNGPSVSHDDDEAGECFRAYADAEESYRDHSDFLKNSQRYAFLFELDPMDYKAWASGLRKAGYATNPKYADKLINFIEKYQLEQYSVAGMLHGITNEEYQTVQTGITPKDILPDMRDDATIKEFKINGLKCLSAPAGTSLLAIATNYNIKLSRLLEINELKKDGILENSQILFLEKKKAEGINYSVSISKQQSLYDIAQQNGVQFTSLCSFNGLAEDAIVNAGTTIYLQPKTTEINTEQAPLNSVAYHTVEPKEGLYAISKKYGVTVSQLKEWNNLSGDQLQIGQKLIISK